MNVNIKGNYTPMAYGTQCRVALRARIKGEGYFHNEGIEQVAEMSFYDLSYNLKKVLKIIRIQKMIEAVT